MAKTDFDFTKAAEEFLASMKIDTSAFDGAAKNAAEFNTKLAKIALDAAKKNAKLTGDWTAETLKKIETNDLNQTKDSENKKQPKAKEPEIQPNENKEPKIQPNENKEPKKNSGLKPKLPEREAIIPPK